MARTSKKAKRQVAGQKPVAVPLRVFSTAIYARLSIDGSDRKNESIQTQIEMAKAYMERQKELVLFDCYSDLGKTGTNFKREGFERLIQDIRMRKVNCVIVKDFSRFGRDYVETGNYIEKIFPFMDVRFISVTDKFDSFAVGTENDKLGMNLKNLVNEMYAKDISIRIRGSRKQRAEQGNYLSSEPPYGYFIQMVDGIRKLEPQEGTADIVKRIYADYHSGKTKREIVGWLYQEKVHPPMWYRRYKHIYQKEGEPLYEWNQDTVKRLLRNPVYLGWTIYYPNSLKKYKVKSIADFDAGDYRMKERTHKPLVTEEVFFHIAEKFEEASEKRKSSRKYKYPAVENIFRDVVHCGECGRKLKRNSTTKKILEAEYIRVYGYFCKNSGRMDGLKCDFKYITLERLSTMVKAGVQQEFALSGMIPKDLVAVSRQAGEEQKKQLIKEENQIGRQIEAVQKDSSEQYLAYRMGSVPQETFIKKKEENDNKIQLLLVKQEEISRKLKCVDGETEKRNHFIRTLLKFQEKSELDYELVNILIQKINVYPDKRVKVVFNFTRRDICSLGKGVDDEEQA